jgi:hypothetical protein
MSTVDPNFLRDKTIQIDYKIVAREILKDYNWFIDRRPEKGPYWEEILFDFLGPRGPDGKYFWENPFSGENLDAHPTDMVLVIRRRWLKDEKRYYSLQTSYSYNDFRLIMQQVSDGLRNK